MLMDWVRGTDPSKPTLVAIKGVVFNISGNAAYGPEGPYHGIALDLLFPISNHGALFHTYF